MIRKLVVILLTGVICLLGITSALAVTYNEAPMLRAMVAAGELPPVEERLPEEPLVVEPIEEIGQYGGTIISSCQWNLNVSESMLDITRDATGVAPGIAKDWKWSDEGKTLTLYLRKGLKWSDGVPFTADDIMFWWEDFQLNEELHPLGPEERIRWSVAGELMTVEKIDDYTVSLRFPAPYPGVIWLLAHFFGNQGCFYGAKHYLEQFHIKYNPKADELAKKEGFDHWYQLFLAKWDRTWNPWGLDPNYPTLRAYVLKEKGPDYGIFERNPYYYKVDPEGNQLPYIDKFKYLVASSDPQVADTERVTGRYDFVTGLTPSYPLYMENAEKGNYRVVLMKDIESSGVCFGFNQCVKDPVLRKIFRDVRFRRALSLAINREEVNDIVFFGKGVPRQKTVIPSSSYFEPEFAKAYAEYDPKEANRLLDEMGLDKRDKEGYRLRADGERLSAIIEGTEAWVADARAQLVKKYWESIGIEITLKPETSELWHSRCRANEHQITPGPGNHCTDILFPLTPNYYIPIDYHAHVGWFFQWAMWYQTGGKLGEEPPEELKKYIEMWEKMMVTSDKDKEEKIRLGKEILRQQARNIWAIGIVEMAPLPLLVRPNLRNVPKEGSIWGWDVVFNYIYDPAQMFFREK